MRSSGGAGPVRTGVWPKREVLKNARHTTIRFGAGEDTRHEVATRTAVALSDRWRAVVWRVRMAEPRGRGVRERRPGQDRAGRGPLAAGNVRELMAAWAYICRTQRATRDAA